MEAKPMEAKPIEAKRKRAEPEAVSDDGADIEAYGEAEPPPQDFGRDRSRSKQKFRELTWAQCDQLAVGLAKESGQEFEPDAVVGVVHGGVYVGGAVARALGCEFFPVRIARRSRDKGSAREAPRIYGEMPAELKGRRVLIVDDVASSGDTLELAQALAREVGAKDVATACLVGKERGYKPGYVAIETDELVVFPWDYDLQ